MVSDLLLNTHNFLWFPEKPRVSNCCNKIVLVTREMAGQWHQLPCPLLQFSVKAADLEVMTSSCVQDRQPCTCFEFHLQVVFFHGRMGSQQSVSCTGGLNCRCIWHLGKVVFKMQVMVEGSTDNRDLDLGIRWEWQNGKTEC